MAGASAGVGGEVGCGVAGGRAGNGGDDGATAGTCGEGEGGEAQASSAWRPSPTRLRKSPGGLGAHAWPGFAATQRIATDLKTGYYFQTF